MIIEWVAIEDFRNHAASQLWPDQGRTLVVGPNGHGKTNLLEAVAVLAGNGSFRGATSDTLVRAGCERGFVRAEIRDGRRVQLVEMEIVAGGRSSVQLNGIRLSSMRDLAEVLTTVVFCPSDLAITAGGPSIRRDLLDEVLAGTDREHRALRSDYERILRQRNRLLKETGRRPDDEALATLDVWDIQLAAAGEPIALRRKELCAALVAPAQEAYEALAGVPAQLGLDYSSSWGDEPLEAALANARQDDLRRGATTTGPHRDDVTIQLNGLPARTHSSQGEQRTIALALRVAQYRYTADIAGVEPVVLLDDVFSELDEGRAARLADCLPQTQTIVTSATGHVPAGMNAGLRVSLCEGEILGQPAAPVRACEAIE